MNTFELSIQTPEGSVFHGQARSISLHAEFNQMQVFAHHASTTASIVFSRIAVEVNGKTEIFLARRGIFYFDNITNTAKLLTMYCKPEKEIDQKHAQNYLEYIENELAKGSDMSKYQLKFLKHEKIAIMKQLGEPRTE